MAHFLVANSFEFICLQLRNSRHHVGPNLTVRIDGTINNLIAVP